MHRVFRAHTLLKFALVTALIGALLLSGSVNTRAEAVQLFERFDSYTPPDLSGSWASAGVVGSGCTWATNNGTVQPSGYASYSAPNLVYMNASACPAGYSARLYRTSGINLVPFEAARVTFWMFRDTGAPDSNDLVQVQVSTDGGATWQYVGAPVSRHRNGVSKWQMVTVDLSAYTGAGMSDVRLAFLGVSQGGNDLHLDDITLTVGPYILYLPAVYKDYVV
jgi:hypothetical protein